MTRPDSLAHTSALPAFINTSTPGGNINISGSVGNGSTATFTTSFNFVVPSTNVMADVYGYNSVTGYKFLLNNLLVASTGIEYAFTSTELCQMNLSYSSTQLTVTYSIFNGTGGTITLVSQTVAITAPIYKLPF